MPQTRWSAETLAWLTTKLQGLGEAKATMPWVRNIMDDFYQHCGNDPLIGTGGYATKDDVLKKVHRWFYNQGSRTTTEHDPTGSEAPMPKPKISTRQLSSRDVFIQQEKQNIKLDLREAGSSTIGDFQTEVSSRMAALTADELNELEIAASKLNYEMSKPYEEHDSSSLESTRQQMAETLGQAINHWEARTGAAIMVNMVFVENSQVRSRCIASHLAHPYLNTDDSSTASTAFAMWFAQSKNLAVSDVANLPRIFPDWDSTLPRFPPGNFDDRPDLQERLIRDYINGIWALQGGSGSTAWSRIEQDETFVSSHKWPAGIPRGDPSHLTKAHKAQLCKFLQMGSMGLVEQDNCFQFSKVIDSDSTEIKCSDAFTECDPSTLNTYWKPAHYTYQANLHASFCDEALAINPLPIQPAWLGFPCVGIAQPFPPELEQCSQVVCELPQWRQLLSLAIKYQTMCPPEDASQLWQHQPLPTVMAQEPTLEVADLMNLIQVPWLSETFFNPTMAGGCQEDTVIFLLQWFNKHTWIHDPSQKCLGGATGVLPVALALGRLYFNIQAAVDPDLGTSTDIPDYVTSEILTQRDLQHVERLIEVLIKHLEDSISFATSNYHERWTTFDIWDQKNTSLILRLATATGTGSETPPGPTDTPETSAVNLPMTLDEDEGEVIESSEKGKEVDARNYGTTLHTTVTTNAPEKDLASLPNFLDLDKWHTLTPEIPLNFAAKLHLLHALTNKLPSTVAEGVSGSVFGVFGCSIEEFCQDGPQAELWERVDPLLNVAIGYNKLPKELSKDLSRGRYGLTGLHNILLGLVQLKGVDTDLLDGKLDRVLEAVRIRCHRKKLPTLEESHAMLQEEWEQSTGNTQVGESTSIAEHQVTNLAEITQPSSAETQLRSKSDAENQPVRRSKRKNVKA